MFKYIFIRTKNVKSLVNLNNNVSLNVAEVISQIPKSFYLILIKGTYKK